MGARSCRLLALLGVWLLLRCCPTTLHAQAQTSPTRRSSRPVGRSKKIAQHQETSINRIISNGQKLRGYKLSQQGDPMGLANRPLMQELVLPVPPATDRVPPPPLSRANGTAHTAARQIPASFIIQVTSRPAAQALAQRSATASPDAARARAQTMAQAVVAQVNQVAAAATVAGKVTATYTHALSGFLVKGPTLTELQALLNDPAVVAVWPNNAVSTLTYSTPQFLGLSPPGGPSSHPSGNRGPVAPPPSAKHNRGQPSSPPPRPSSSSSSSNKAPAAPGGGKIVLRPINNHNRNINIKARKSAYEGGDDGGSSYDEYDAVGGGGYKDHNPGADSWYTHAGGGDSYGHSGSSNKYGGSHNEIQHRDYFVDSMYPSPADPHKQPYVWDLLGGVLGPSGAGENIVIGVIDDGIWMEDHPSFAESDYWTTGHGNAGQYYNPLHGWNGICQPSNDSSTFECNNKVIGCRWFNTFWEDLLPVFFPEEVLGCTSVRGHGTTSAAIAAGNYGAKAGFIPDKDALLSGMAPRARISVYKACWGAVGVCWPSDIVAAYDAAIQDGVDIINHSLGGDVGGELTGPISTAQMTAAAANIFVAAAAGNSGPEPATVDNIPPWVTTVAASYQARKITSTVTFANGKSIEGHTNPDHTHIGPAPLIWAGDAAAAGVSAEEAAGCEYGVLDPLLTSGAIVICNFFYTKTGLALSEIQRVNGVAVILAQVTPDDAIEFPAPLPYVQIGPDERLIAIRESRRVGRAPPTAKISAPVFSYDNTAPAMAYLSSRGPARIHQILKPDITAPGIEITAAVSPFGRESFYAGALYDTSSGTSWSTPHIAGIAALIKQMHPSWSPMSIKSAIMSTAYQLTRTGKTGLPFGSPYEYGAGHVDALAALNPGLVINSGPDDWMAFVCALDPSATECGDLKQSKKTTAQAALYSRPPNSQTDRTGDSTDQTDCVIVGDLNTPSIAGITSGAMRVQRTLTAVLGDSSSSSRVRFEGKGLVDADSCMHIEVWPSVFEVSDGDSVDVWVTISARDDTIVNSTQTGQVVLYSHEGHRVAIPVAVNFTALNAPAAINFDMPASAGPVVSSTFNLGAVRPQELDLLAVMQPGSISSAVADANRAEVSTNITLPSTGDYVGVARLFGQDYPSNIDLDLELYLNRADGSRKLVAFSKASGSSDETVSFAQPGEYTVVAIAYGDDDTAIFPFNVNLYFWTLPLDGSDSTNPALMTVTPDTLATSPEDPCGVEVIVSVTGLEATAEGGLPNRYLGVVLYTERGTGWTVGRSYINVA